MSLTGFIERDSEEERCKLVYVIPRTKTNQENARNEFDYLGCHESVSVPESGPLRVAAQPVRFVHGT